MNKGRWVNFYIIAYTITLKDSNGTIVGEKKANNDIIVHDSNSETSTSVSTLHYTASLILNDSSPILSRLGQDIYSRHEYPLQTIRTVPLSHKQGRLLS